MSYPSSCPVCPKEALSTPLLLSGSEGWVIRRDPFSPAFNTSQMLVRIQLLQVPQFPWQATLVCGLSLPFPWLHTSELKSAQQLLKLGIAFCFHSVLHILYTNTWWNSQNEKRHCKGIPFLPLFGLFPLSSPSLLSLHRHTQELPKPEAGKVQSGVCLSLLNPNHFIHHLPKQEIKPKISLSSSDVVYFLSPTFSHWDYFRTR